MLQTAEELLVEQKLCDHCLGRQFALLGYGLTNNKRGEIIKEALALALYEKLPGNKKVIKAYQNMALLGNELATNCLKRKKCPEAEKDSDVVCQLCGGLFEQLEAIGSDVVQKLQTEDFATFLVGTKFLPELIEKEDQLRAKYRIQTGETIKEEFTRELGKLLAILTNKEPSFELPDITIILDLIQQKTIIQRRSLYIYGRYQKLIRTIPQTKWPCHSCNGQGCEVCNNTGKLYQESVEELIAKPVLEKIGGTDSKFHGAGREDINALMLGNGRPFVLEIIEPQTRTFNAKALQRYINRKTRKKVQVSGLTTSSKRKVQEIKSLATKTKKTYRAKIALEQTITQEKITELIQTLDGAVIKQRTPQRVAHRRADLQRTRKVFALSVKKLSEKEIIAEITGAGGLYIKELISGDDGRTQPSFASVLGYGAICSELDVIHLHYTED